VRVSRGSVLRRGTLAQLLAVLEPSPFRVAPRCRHAAVCGGCTWQHVAYAEQLRWKTRHVEKRLRAALGERAPRVEPTIGLAVGEDGMPWGFRQKSTFVFGSGPGGLTLGHFARGTHDVVPLAECPVHAERANRIAFALRDELRRAGISAAGEGLEGLARHVLVRTTRDGSEAVALLVATRPDAALDAPLQALIAGRERPEGLALNLHDRPGPYLVGRETRRIDGAGHVREQGLGPVYLVSPTAFFQTNVAAARILLDLVVAACEKTAARPLRLLDLYSGGGLFAVAFAARGHSVVAVEESRKGTRDAELNARQNGIPESRLRLVPAAVESALPRLRGESFDAVVLDPPRAGCPAEVLRAVFRGLRPPRAVLVSCNPDALARELPQAVAAGYRVLSVQPVDMFPHTPHVETVAVLALAASRAAEPGGAKPPRDESARERRRR
jgi:23S rRNA (uracil1939-C5)-methyltransferase